MLSYSSEETKVNVQRVTTIKVINKVFPERLNGIA
jgi:hypothetical protein